MSAEGQEPSCWNCSIPAREVPLIREGQNWICRPCQQEIDDLITTGKDWSHASDDLNDYANGVEG